MWALIERALGSRAWLGVCAAAVAVAALTGAFDSTLKLGEQTAEQECRYDLDATLLIMVAEALQRTQEADRAMAIGDEEAARKAVATTPEQRAAFTLAVTNARDAVLLCELRS